MYDERPGAFESPEGPVSANAVLADEINRTSPKTGPRSPRQQKDRFLVKTSFGYPDEADERATRGAGTACN